jgi:hypothetical protein
VCAFDAPFYSSPLHLAAVRMSATPSAEDVDRMAADVALAFPNEPAFVPTTVLVVTYFAVGYCCSFQDKL